MHSNKSLGSVSQISLIYQKINAARQSGPMKAPDNISSSARSNYFICLRFRSGLSDDVAC